MRRGELGGAEHLRVMVRAAAIARHEHPVRPRSTAATLWRGGMRIPLRLNPLDRLDRAGRA